MRIGVIRATESSERRVALVPESAKRLVGKGIAVCVERSAGVAAGYGDEAYIAEGASVVERYDALASDVIVAVRAPPLDELGQLARGTMLISLLQPFAKADMVRVAAARGLVTLALELIPRTTQAQSMDVLSSQANLAGYWAVVAAAARLPKIFPLLMTAAGTITPARVLVIGAGVAGLQAIGTARRLGAVVEATDVRPEVREQVESVGGRFLAVDGLAVAEGKGGYAAEQSDAYKAKQTELVTQAIARADVVITTALIPGRKAPRLVTDAQVASMRAGSVIVDLAAEQGGNVEGCAPGRDIERHGVLILAPENPASQVAFHASLAFSRNVEKLLEHVTTGGSVRADLDDELSRACLVTKGDAIVHPGVRQALGG